MTIRRVGFTSFKISFDDLIIVTDPFMTMDAGDKFAKMEADIVLLTEPKFVGEHMILEGEGFDKIVPKNRDKVYEISSPGDYELGGVIIRRMLNSNFFVIDKGDLRVVYVGYGSAEIKDEELKDLGDVDMLIMPVGGDEPLASYEKIAKMITAIDPTRLIPSCYSDGVKLSTGFKEVKGVQDFIKNAGYTHVNEESKVKVKKGTEADNKLMEVIILK